MRIHVQTPDARPMNEVIAEAFRSFECAPLGGASEDGWSKLADLQRCQYRYYLKHVLGAVAVDPTDANLRVPNPPPLEIGGLFHAVLALHYARRLSEGYPGWRPNLPNPMAFLDRIEGLKCELGHVNAVRLLYYGYSEYYGPEFDMQPVAVEHGAGVKGVHTCRYDAIVHKDGGLWNLETKTATRDTPDISENWWLDGEIVGQHYVWQFAGLDKVFGRLTGTIINIAFKTTPATFKRIEIVLPQKVVDAYAADRAHWNGVRNACVNTGRWPRSLTGCVSRYDRCAWWHHCRDMDDSLVAIRRNETEKEARNA